VCLRIMVVSLKSRTSFCVLRYSDRRNFTRPLFQMQASFSVIIPKSRSSVLTNMTSAILDRSTMTLRFNAGARSLSVRVEELFVKITKTLRLLPRFRMFLSDKSRLGPATSSSLRNGAHKDSLWKFTRLF
jgi:hypothetical protein